MHHHKAFSRNRRELSLRAEAFAQIPLRVDPLHFRGHGKNVGVNEGDDHTWAAFCEKECNPLDHKITSSANSEVCEQVRYLFR